MKAWSLHLFLPALLWLVLLLCFASCKEESSQKETESSLEPEIADTVAHTLNKELRPPPKPIIYEYFYVSAKSGLNYRDAPKGKVLGKFLLNAEVKILVHTEVFDQIQDGKQQIKGEWLGVELGTDTVYVFDGFLSESFTFYDVKIYYASPAYEMENEKVDGFINLSESLTWDHEREAPAIFPQEHEGKSQVILSQKLKEKALKEAGFSKNDKVFIYNFTLDSVFTFEIKALPMAARPNVYFGYEVGLDLGKKYTSVDESFAYIGQKNPFQTGEINPITWRKISQEEFPKKFETFRVNDHRKKWFASAQSGDSFTFTQKNLSYFIQNIVIGNSVNHRYLVVMDSKAEKIVFEELYIDSESTYLTPLKIENGTNESEYQYQWTGALFKGKPSIIYGLLGVSFGCPGISFLDQSEAPIRILCDNRH